MPRKPHPSEAADARQIGRAVSFTAHARNSPADKITVACETLAQARNEAIRLCREYCRGGRRAAVYAVTPEKWTILVPDSYQAANSSGS
jgi:hypothetical protein